MAMIQRCARLAVAAVVVGALTGCSLLSGVKFTNVSDSWLNVRYYVGVTEEPVEEGVNPLYREESIQIEPGGSVNYRAPKNLVHVRVETVTPTWEPTGREYWLELLTEPPIHVVANGRGDKIEFKSFTGEIAMIPDKERERRFEYVDPQKQAEMAAAGANAYAGPPSPSRRP